MLTHLILATTMLASSAVNVQTPDEAAPLLQGGPWCAWLASPGGELPFVLHLQPTSSGLGAFIVNGDERIVVPSARIEGADVVLEFPHYDAEVRATIVGDGRELAGAWTKRSGAERWTVMEFGARLDPALKCTENAAPDALPATGFDGRWAVDFAADDDLAIGVFRSGGNDRMQGTFMTTTGDHRYLAGYPTREGFMLACFDGAHAFLFKAVRTGDEELRGDFWSGDRWHDTWTAKHDEDTPLASGYDRVRWQDGVALANLVYGDIDGVPRSLGELALDHKGLVIQILGSWCPNCHDETALMARFEKQYRARGLGIVGLAFEYSGDYQRDAEQLRRMRARHNADYPFLLAGSNDKQRAVQAFPALDRIFAFPTTIFLYSDGRVRAVHSGFTGPATGDPYIEVQREFVTFLEAIVEEPRPDDSEQRKLLLAETWRDEREGTFVSFEVDKDGVLRFKAHEGLRFDRPTNPDPVAQGVVNIAGTTVRLGTEVFFLDKRAGGLLDPRDCGRRLTPAARSRVPFIDRQPSDPVEFVTGLSSTDALVRRETVYFVALATAAGQYEGSIDLAPLLADADGGVRATAAWAAGTLGARATVPQLLECLTHGAPAVRREAVRALGKLGDKSALEALRKLKQDVDPLVRNAVSEALAALSG